MAKKIRQPDKTRNVESDAAEDRVIAAARKLFFEYAYQDVSTDALAAASKASKTTIYKRFKDKEAIFAAVIDHESLKYQRNIPAGGGDDAIWSAVRDFGVALLELILDPQTARFEQLVVSQAHADRSMATLFYARAHGNAYERLAGLLEAGLERGEFALHSDLRTTAVDLVSLWKADLHERGQLSLLDRLPDGLEQHVTRCMRLVLKPAQAAD